MHPPVKNKKKKELLIADQKRQATDTLRAYSYQIYQSVYAWINLKETQTLALEGAEDFDIYDDNQVDTIQVKDTSKSGNVTLRSKGVIEAIKNFWECQKNNPDYIISFRYLTTSNRGREKDSPFPDKLGGLDFWDLCKNQLTDPKILINYLSTLPLSTDLISYLQANDINQILNILIRKISWDTGRKPSDAIKGAIDNKIAYDGYKLGVHSIETDVIRSVLFEKIIEIISSKDLRITQFKDYLDILYQKTSILVDRSKYNQLKSSYNLTQSLYTTFPFAQQMPQGFGQLMNLAPSTKYRIPDIFKGATKRESLINVLEQKLKENKILFLSGSSGTGKSTVALLLANVIDRTWSWINLRSIDDRQLSDFLFNIGYLIDNNNLNPFLILDDINFGRHFKEYDFAIQSLLYKVRNENGFTIVTSQKETPEDLVFRLWLKRGCKCEIPYFNEDEIIELIKNHGCKSQPEIELYSRIIQITTNNGHPQLCHARVRHLQNRNWPKLSSDDILSPQEIKDEKETVRQKLIDELPSKDERNLLYRLSVFSRYFKKEVAISLGSVEPSISLPGESFEILIGPWIERVGKEYFRLTPLLSGAAYEVYNNDQINELRIAAVEAVLKQKRLTPFEISDALALSLTSKSENHLAWIVQGLISPPLKVRKFISDELYWFGLIALSQGEKIFQKNSFINFLLRLLQYDVVANSDDNKRAIDVALRLKDDIQDLDIPELKDYSEVMYCLKILLGIEVPFSFDLIFKVFLRYGYLFYKIQDKHNFFDLEKIQDNSGWSYDPINTLAEIQMARIKSLSILDDFLSALDSLNEKDRNKIIQVINQCDHSIISTAISFAWTPEIDKKEPNFEKAIQIYEKAANKGIEWNFEFLGLIAFENISVLFDEHFNNPQKALQVLERAIEVLGGTRINLENQRAKILYHQENYKDALKIWRLVIPEMRKAHLYGNVGFTERLSGNASAYLSDWNQAADFYQFASESAEKGNLQILKVGLAADKAFALWKANRKEEALKTLINIASEIGKLSDPNVNLNSYMLNKKFGYTLSWMKQDFDGEYLENYQEPPPGFISNPDTKESIKDHPIVKDVFLWYFLAEIESRLNLRLGAAKKFEIESTKCNLPTINMMVSYGKLRKSFQRVDFKNLIFDFKELCYNLQAVLRHKDSGLSTHELSSKIKILESDLCSDDNKSLLYYLIILAITSILLKKELFEVPKDKWIDDCSETKMLNGQIYDLLCKLSEIYNLANEKLIKIMKDSTATNNDRLVACLKIMKDGELSPENMYIAHVTLLMFFSKIEYKSLMENDFAEAIIKTWGNIINNMRFAILSPHATVPEIEAAINRSEHGLKKVAYILLAAIKAVKINLSVEQIKELKQIAGGKGGRFAVHK